jgi:hypothetical protein
LLTYADDIDIIARSQSSLREAFLALECAAKRMGIWINQEKTKYMTSGQCTTQNANITIDNYTFKTVQIFTYLGSSVKCNNDISQEVRKRILTANSCFYGLRNQLKSQILSRKNKILLYKTLIRPVLTYASETWVSTKSDEKTLAVFERKILRAIYGPIKDNDGESDITLNCMLYIRTWI